jgi:UDP-glucose:(heptosyl)LPS alpha-1,3-glucosyltransferase
VTVIVQITPEIGPGTGVGAVAHHLEKEWNRLGIDTTRFGLEEAGGGWLPKPAGGVQGRLALLSRVVWFSTVGTVRARRYLRANPEVLSVCHNDALAGDVYVNHGIVQAAMRSRGRHRVRMLRNPVVLFAAARDRIRYTHAGTHRLVVNLVAAEDDLLREIYPALAIRTVVIGNGVDIDRFSRPTALERAEARKRLGRAPHDRVVLFIGNEFGRKGLPLLLDAMRGLDVRTHLYVVGGTSDLVAQVASSAHAAGLDGRVHFEGPQVDPRPWLRSADVLAMPSAYESFGLVVLEALACGVPVVATPTGCVPDLIIDGVNGAVVDARAESVAAGITRVFSGDVDALADRARATAEEHSWSRVAQRYLDVLSEVHRADIDGSESRTAKGVRP